MTPTAVLLIILVIGFVFINIGFRYQALHVSRYLVQNRIEFTARHIFNNRLLETEIIPRYPDHAQAIRSFCKLIRRMTRITAIWILLVVVLSCILYSQN